MGINDSTGSAGRYRLLPLIDVRKNISLTFMGVRVLGKLRKMLPFLYYTLMILCLCNLSLNGSLTTKPYNHRRNRTPAQINRGKGMLFPV